jgi:hypothetical protein
LTHGSKAVSRRPESTNEQITVKTMDLRPKRGYKDDVKTTHRNKRN